MVIASGLVGVLHLGTPGWVQPQNPLDVLEAVIIKQEYAVICYCLFPQNSRQYRILVEMYCHADLCLYCCHATVLALCPSQDCWEPSSAVKSKQMVDVSFRVCLISSCRGAMFMLVC